MIIQFCFVFLGKSCVNEAWISQKLPKKSIQNFIQNLGIFLAKLKGRIQNFTKTLWEH